MTLTPNLGLTAWDRAEDLYDHTQLANNFVKIDGHDHTPSGGGRRITSEALADGSVTGPKIPDGSLVESKYATGSVSARALATDIIGSAQIQNGSVTTQELADRSVTKAKLDANVVPVGTIITWWRASVAQPIPEGWEVADGRTVIFPLHDFAGGGTVTLPDMRNRFALGAAVGGTGTTPALPPAIGQVGGTNEANLSHTHTVNAHSHVVDAHTHPVPAHTHVVAHRHTVEAHSHVVNSHTHVVGGHGHNVPAHTHPIPHIHGVEGHSHGISGDGAHNHGLVARSLFATDFPYEYASKVLGTGANNFRSFIGRATAYVSGAIDDAGNGISVPGVPPHSHGGSTGVTGGQTGQPTSPSSGATGLSTDANADFSSGSSAPGTSTSNPFTTTETPTTSAVALTTSAAGSTTQNTSPGTNASLGTTDIRPSFVGLIFLIKVKS